MAAGSCSPAVILRDFHDTSEAGSVIRPVTIITSMTQDIINVFINEEEKSRKKRSSLGNNPVVVSNVWARAVEAEERTEQR